MAGSRLRINARTPDDAAEGRISFQQRREPVYDNGGAPRRRCRPASIESARRCLHLGNDCGRAARGGSRARRRLACPSGRVYDL